VAKFTPPYATAYKATLIGYLVGVVAAIVYDVLTGIGLATNLYRSHIITLFIIRCVGIGFFVQVACYATLIKYPNQEPLGFVKGCLVGLLQVIGGCILFLGLLDVGFI